MAEVIAAGASLGNTLSDLLLAPDIEPGADPSYQLCKAIYLYHPLGRKMAEAPTILAQSQAREVVVDDAPSDRVVQRFRDVWDSLGCDKHIFNVVRQSRIYGIASIAALVGEEDPAEPMGWEDLASKEVGFNVLDPLNTAGSLVLNQDPNAPDFQKHAGIRVFGKKYHRSREVTLLNEEPIYIAFTSSAFGFVGRSVYQRALFPLKSFVQTMITDDLISLKVGVLVAKVKNAGSIVNQAMKTFVGLKRDVVKEAQVGNVISVGPDEAIESIDMQNLDGPFELARKNILKNIATAADMPAALLENETMVSGFGEGTEDAKNIAKFVDRHRQEIDPVYAWFDRIAMRKAWTEEFYETIRHDFPEEYKDVPYQTAFVRWQNSFKAKWPSLLTEPDSERAKTEKVKLEGVVSVIQVLGAMLDPENKARLVQWAVDEVNESELLFATDLDFDADEFAAYVPPDPFAEGSAGAGEEEKQALRPPRPMRVTG